MKVGIKSGSVSSFILAAMIVITGSAGTMHCSRTNSLQLDQMGPNYTEPGAKFQVQENGESAIWITGKNITADTKIMWGETQLETTFGDTEHLTALVPDSQYAKPGKYAIYLLDAKTRNASNKLFFQVGAAGQDIKLLKMGPTSTKANKSFQVQPNGVSAIWILGENFSNSMKIVWDKTELETTYNDPTKLTAYVPETLYAAPGKYAVYVSDVKTKAKSNSLTFTVK